VAGKANAEVERVMRKLLGCPVRLVGGASGRTKLLEADLDGPALQARLSELFG
jgi:uncharacterized protein YggU (UPF0235/DUF167 family)